MKIPINPHTNKEIMGILTEKILKIVQFLKDGECLMIIN